MARTKRRNVDNALLAEQWHEAEQPTVPSADNVKRWRAGDMRLRWIAAGLLAAEKQFRRIRGHKLIPRLVSALGTEAIAGKTQAA